MLEEFNATDLSRASKKVFESAVKNPVIIRRPGGNALILMSKSEYIKLKGKG